MKTLYHFFLLCSFLLTTIIGPLASAAEKKYGTPAAIRIMPADPFMGGISRNISIDQITITGDPHPDSIQGVVSPDGCLVNVILTNSIVDIGSLYKIAFNGLASGHLDGFVDGEGKTVPARLQPLRIGGNSGTGNVWVLSVSPKEHECNPGKITGSNYVPELDKRRVLPNPQAKQDIGLCDFKLDEFKRDVKSKTVNELLANPDNQAKVDDWLESVKTTEQPEFKGQYDAIKKSIDEAVKQRSPIDKLQAGGRLQPVFYQLIAQNYGTPCSQAQDKTKP